MDACLESEMLRTLYAEDALVPIQDVSGRENLQCKILALPRANTSSGIQIPLPFNQQNFHLELCLVSCFT